MRRKGFEPSRPKGACAWSMRVCRSTTSAYSIILFLKENAKEKKEQGSLQMVPVPLINRSFNAAGYRLSCSLEVSLRIKMAHKRAKMQTTNPGMPPSGPNSPPVIKVWFEVVKYIKDDSLSKPLTWNHRHFPSGNSRQSGSHKVPKYSRVSGVDCRKDPKEEEMNSREPRSTVVIHMEVGEHSSWDQDS